MAPASLKKGSSSRPGSRVSLERRSRSYQRTVRSRPRPSGDDGLFSGEQRARGGRSSCSCARENRGPASGGDCAVGRCASRVGCLRKQPPKYSESQSPASTAESAIANGSQVVHTCGGFCGRNAPLRPGEPRRAAGPARKHLWTRAHTPPGNARFLGFSWESAPVHKWISSWRNSGGLVVPHSNPTTSFSEY